MFYLNQQAFEKSNINHFQQNVKAGPQCFWSNTQHYCHLGSPGPPWSTSVLNLQSVVTAAWSTPSRINISKNKSCFRSTYYASGCAHYWLLRLERLEISWHTKVYPERDCYTELPPMLPDILYNSITPPDLLLIHFASRIPLETTRLLHGFPAFYLTLRKGLLGRKLNTRTCSWRRPPLVNNRTTWTSRKQHSFWV